MKIVMSICRLPAEVLEVIFQNLDGWSFSRAKEVCKCWCDVIKTMQKNQRLWQKFCVLEIPEGVIEDVLSFKSIPFGNLIMDWSALYKKWYRGRMIKGKHFHIKNIQYRLNPVICMKISGSWIIAGHSNGFLSVWNLHTGELSQKRRCHLKMVTDMALVDLLNLGSYYGSENLPWAHHHIITVSKDTCIRIMSLLEHIGSSESEIVLNKHGDVIYSVRIFGKQFVVGSRDNTVTLWHLELKRNPVLHLEVTLLQTIIGPADMLLGLGFWYNTIYCISQADRLRIHDFERDKWVEQRYFKSRLSKGIEEVKGLFNWPVITSYFAFRDQIIIMFTASGKMVISINENNYKVYTLMNTLESLVVGVALQGTILALGGENGRLYLYYVPDSKSLLELDLRNPTFQYTLSEASIVSVDILYDYDSPTVVASTNESLYVIKWYKNSATKSNESQMHLCS
ncbi:uncharacterized protein LOC129960785 isoform X1 [Argiope bruennichi]|uniref:uncharacterized protein LOC129960785 isoform X1 n=2 Tax=Argiope bruennichi TaxID=94029 RepID=UPI0024940AC8|nr:uncharacterized protein LOC129960785 isoform X1 [Argiope bruennichi]